MPSALILLQPAQQPINKMQQKMHFALASKSLSALVLATLLVACSSSGGKPKPTELTALLPLISVRQAWVNPVGAGQFASTLSVHGDSVFVASGNGTIARINVRSGADVWRVQLDTPLSAGVGSDGHLSAVVTQKNDLIAIVGGKEIWRHRLSAATYTSPFVAGQRVFVLNADRTVSAFDGNSGARLWSQNRTGEPLVLRQSGALLAVGDTLVAGLGGRMVGFNPNNGSIRWEAAVAAPRGSNDVERMVDLIGPVSRIGDEVCARAFQVTVGCVDAQRGRLKWSQPADGHQGLNGDDRLLFGTESDGRVVAWQRNTGQKAWTYTGLLHRNLAAPLVLGRSVAVPDGFGYIHLLSREDGSPMARLTTDGSPIASAPVMAGDALIVLTQNGNLFAWQPQ